MVLQISAAIIALSAFAVAAVATLMFRRQHAARGRSAGAAIRKFVSPVKPTDMITVARVFPARMRADLQRTLDESLRSIAEVTRFSGLRSAHYAPDGLSFNSAINGADTVELAAPQYEHIDVGDETPVRCVSNGLWLLTKGNDRFVVLLVPAFRDHRMSGMRLEIATTQGAAGHADALFAEVERGVARAASYRGKVLSLEKADSYSGQSRGITVHALRPVNREDVILPESVLRQLDQNIIQFTKMRSSLVSGGFSSKKGLLFHGAPGTGKTHTLHYLVSALNGHTFLLIAADQQQYIAEYMSLARLLQPSVVVIEDADLIAGRREDATPGVESLLNKLLNEMDGLKPDADVLFILTTNRPDTLEPALIARPGRIDQAVEFPLPDATCRRRLVKLYGTAAKISEESIDAVVRRTDGVSASFIKECVRRAAQISLERTSTDGISASDVDAALDDMLASGPLGLRLVGGATPAS